MDFDDDRDLIQEIKKELKCVQITFHCNLPVKFPEKEINFQKAIPILQKDYIVKHDFEQNPNCISLKKAEITIVLNKSGSAMIFTTKKETNLRQNLLELWKIIENYQT